MSAMPATTPGGPKFQYSSPRWDGEMNVFSSDERWNSRFRSRAALSLGLPDQMTRGIKA